MAYGVTTTGFVNKDFNTLVEENRARALSSFGSEIDVSDEAPLGMIINNTCVGFSELWDLGEGVYNSQYQQYAEGVPLDNAMALTNNTRNDAQKSTVVETITGTNGTIIPQGFRVNVSGDSTIIFETSEQNTIPVAGNIDVTMIATDYGAKVATAGTVTVINTPVFGVTSVTNSANATVGRDTETDADFKITGKNNKQKAGTSPVDGIRKAILEVDNIVQVTVNENNTDVIDGDGRPPHSTESVVQGGADADIGTAIFKSKSAGIETFGSVSVNVTDNSGTVRVVKFNRPTSVPIYIIVNVTKNTDINEGALYPADGDDQIKAAIVKWGADFLIGRDVLKDGANGLINPINTVAGIRELTVFFAITVTPTTSTPISISNNSLASFILANITVNS